MQARSFSAPLAVLLLLVGGVVPAGAGQPPKQDSPKPLPKEIVAAWEKAGGEPGWMGLHSLGFFVFAEESTGLTGAIPAFHFFFVWEDGVVSKLPVPAAPFGLDLIETKVTDAGVKELVGLKSLHTLNLGGTHVTDAGLKELANLKSLHALFLGGTQVTDAGLKELAGLKSLHTLWLFGTQVTDAGLKELAGLKSLHTLNLGGTQVTDVGLKQLAGLKDLHTLNLVNTKVTNAGVVELRKALPDCRITR